VTDRKIEELGLMSSMTESLKREGIEYMIFNEVEEDPSAENVLLAMA
jgi:alcohol dehydrogenase class IV